VATSISAFACKIPAGTTTTVPLNVNAADPVESIHWRVPPGPRGHLAWWLTQSGVQVLPNMFGTSMVCDGEWDTWQLNNFPQSGAWALVGINSGTNDHWVYLEFAHQQATPGLTGAGSLMDGYPTLDADIPTMWLAAAAGPVI
jgi:hypothetical protein